MRDSNGNELYRCDPDKNHWCSKTNCYRRFKGCCKHTHEKQYEMSLGKRIKEWFSGIR